MRLIHDDCIEGMKKLLMDKVEVDLILTDPPYGTIKNIDLDRWTNSTTAWDNTINPKLMFCYSEKLLRMNGRLILFSQESYTSFLRRYSPLNLNFNYPLIWKKNDFANYLGYKKAPVSYFEDLTVWTKKYDSNLSHPLRVYATNILDYIIQESGKGYRDIERDLGHRKVEHFLGRPDSMQFTIPSEKAYNELVDKYGLDKMNGFMSYFMLKKIWKEYSPPVFNLWRDKKRKSNVLEYDRPRTHYHPTEKPVALLEDLIKTYTNLGDTVLDFTMGSGSTGVACVNTGRDFIGIELDENYYNIAVERIKDSNAQTRLI